MFFSNAVLTPADCIDRSFNASLSKFTSTSPVIPFSVIELKCRYETNCWRVKLGGCQMEQENHLWIASHSQCTRRKIATCRLWPHPNWARCPCLGINLVLGCESSRGNGGEVEWDFTGSACGAGQVEFFKSWYQPIDFLVRPASF